MPEEPKPGQSHAILQLHPIIVDIELQTFLALLLWTIHLLCTKNGPNCYGRNWERVFESCEAHESEDPAPNAHFEDLMEPDKVRSWSPLFDAYPLGDYLQDNFYCNAVIDEFLERLEEDGHHPNSDIIQKYWEGIPKASKFRELLIETRTWLCSGDTFQESAHDSPQDARGCGTLASVTQGLRSTARSY